MARLRAGLWREVDPYMNSNFSVTPSSNAYLLLSDYLNPRDLAI